jgi:hypothetical protein
MSAKNPNHDKLRHFGQLWALAVLLSTGRRITEEQRIFVMYEALNKEPEGNEDIGVLARKALSRLRAAMREEGIVIPRAEGGRGSDGGVQLAPADAKKLRELLVSMKNLPRNKEFARNLREAADFLDPPKEK